MQVWSALIILGLCPLLGGVPIIEWITWIATGKKLSSHGTGNIGVSAAFYHGGLWVGLLAVTVEALKGIGAVLLARHFFPFDPTWELVALLMLVLGRYWMGRGAGTTNVVWGYVVYDPAIAAITTLLAGISFTVLREKKQGRMAVLIIFPALTLLYHSLQPGQCLMAIALASVIGWIYQQMPDDLDLSPSESQPETQKLFRFFRGDRTVVTLNQPLSPAKVGNKAATLSQLKQWGYPVPPGWVLLPGDDPVPLLDFLSQQVQPPYVVRSSAMGEDTATASAAGVYDSVLQVHSRETLERAIAKVLASYDLPSAIKYRQDRQLPESNMAVLIQPQIQGAFSGVAFSRDPMQRSGDAVVIEALPGTADQIVSGRVTPETYRVRLRETEVQPEAHWLMPDGLKLSVEGSGKIPQMLVQQVAYLTRHLEARFHGVPQDVEWTYDGRSLWVLQSRPITTLVPIWTRKIAAEVLPGAICPLTWSINHPLTCGVWGDLFSLALGDRAGNLDFQETATLHHSYAYFNATLLGEIFLRMGLPPESLEFLTRGQKMSRPPIGATLKNLRGLWQLWQRERQVLNDFNRDDKAHFQPCLKLLEQHNQSYLNLNNLEPDHLDPSEILNRIRCILVTLRRATYYSILAPLSVALRQALSRTSDAKLDYHRSPEVAALRSLQSLSTQVHEYFKTLSSPLPDPNQLEDTLQKDPEGQAIWRSLQDFLQTFGYLSDVGTDIAVPTWKEDPTAIYAGLLATPPVQVKRSPAKRSRSSVQQRVDLKGRVAEVYGRFLAELRWSFVALESHWRSVDWLESAGDIFFLTFTEIEEAILRNSNPFLLETVTNRKAAWQQDASRPNPPALVYGKNSPPPILRDRPPAKVGKTLQGIGASPGSVEGRVKVIKNLRSLTNLEPNCILVVPFTDSGWAPLLARAAGLIAEVGGRLSHGAIVAREYGIPAVMDISHATQQLQDGQIVRIDGQQGTVEILS